MDTSPVGPHDEGMNAETTTPHTAPSQGPSTSPPLRRPHEGRVVAGVAAALARRMGIPSWVVRLGFVITAFWGGLGVIAYLAGWLLIPEQGRDRPLAAEILEQPRGLLTWVGAGLIALALLMLISGVVFAPAGPWWRSGLPGELVVAAVLLVLGVLLYRGELGGPSPDPSGAPSAAPSPAAALDRGASEPPAGTTPPPGPAPAPPPAPPPPPPPPRSILGRLTLGAALIAMGILGLVETASPLVDARARHYLALALAVIGAGLLLGAVLGRARGLILVGFLLIPVLLASVFADGPWRAGWAEVRYTPASVAELEPVYELEAGELTLDLRRVQPDGEQQVAVRLGAGSLRVLVPEGVGVEVEAGVEAGDIEVLGRRSSGLGASLEVTEPGDGRLVLDLTTDLGEIRVLRGERITPEGGE